LKFNMINLPSRRIGAIAFVGCQIFFVKRSR
jgi:hypothetical protein